MDGHGVPGADGVRAGGDQLDVLEPADGGVERVDRARVGVDRVHQGEPRRQQFVLVRAVEGQAQIVQADHGVEVASVREVVGHGAVAGDLRRESESGAEGGDVGQGNGGGGAVLHPDVDAHQPGGGVQPHGGDRLGDLHHAGLHQDGGHPDGAVPAHRQTAGDLHEQDPEVGVGAGRRLEHRPAHRRVSARLVHQQGPHRVPVRHEVGAALGHGGAGERADATGDHAGGHALGVRVDGVEDVTRAQVSPSVVRPVR